MSTPLVSGAQNNESHEDIYNDDESLHSTENDNRAGSVGSGKNDEAETSIIPQDQVQEVRHMKIAILGVLLISILGAVAIFLRSKMSAQEQFKRQFSNDAYKVNLFCSDDLLELFCRSSVKSYRMRFSTGARIVGKCDGKVAGST